MTVKEDFNVLSAGVFFTSECFNFDTIDIIRFIYNTLKGRTFEFHGIGPGSDDSHVASLGHLC